MRTRRDAGRTGLRASEQDRASHVKPLAENLARKVTRAEHRVAELESHARFRHRWLAEHPELARRMEHTQRGLQGIHDPIGADLLHQLGAASQPEIPEISAIPDPAAVARIRARLDRLQQRGIDPPALSL